MLIPIDTNKKPRLEKVWTNLISPFLKSVKEVYNIDVSGSVTPGNNDHTMLLTLDFKSVQSKNFVSPLLSEFLKYPTEVMEGVEIVKMQETESTTEVLLSTLDSRYELILSARNKISPFCHVFPIDSKGSACTIPKEGGKFLFSVVSSYAVSEVRWDFLPDPTASTGSGPSISGGLGRASSQVGASMIEPTLDINKAKRETNYSITVPENTTGSPRILEIRVSGSINRNIEIKQL